MSEVDYDEAQEVSEVDYNELDKVQYSRESETGYM